MSGRYDDALAFHNQSLEIAVQKGDREGRLKRTRTRQLCTSRWEGLRRRMSTVERAKRLGATHDVIVWMDILTWCFIQQALVQLCG